MDYKKPELFLISLAATVTRESGTGNGGTGSDKSTTTGEASGDTRTNDGAQTTSSTSSAYQSDE